MDKERPGFNPAEEGDRHREELVRGFEVGFETLPSERHPDRNEDAVLIDEKKRLFGVFDGLGGHAAGDLAADLAMKSIGEAMRDSLNETDEIYKVESELRKAFATAHKAILEAAADDYAKMGMGTTAAVVKIAETREGDYSGVVAHLGDSRVFRFESSGRFEQVTRDHGVLRALAESRDEETRIQDRLDDAERIEDIKGSGRVESFWLQRNRITAALGIEDQAPDIEVIALSKGDMLLLTTDGIHDNLTNEEMRLILSGGGASHELAKRLSDKAAVRSRDKSHIRAKPDDMSVVLVRVASS